MNNHSGNGQLSRRERERLRHRREIINAAIHLFAKQGFDQTRLEEVASLAEFGKGTLYNYFENKTDLLISSFETVLDDMIHLAGNKLEGVTGLRPRLRVLANNQFELLEQNAGFIQMLISQHRFLTQVIPEEFRPGLMQKLHTVQDLITDEMRQALERGELREGCPKRYATYFLGMIHSQIRAINMGLMQLDEVNVDEILDVFLEGSQA